jgi:hypothetical protein
MFEEGFPEFVGQRKGLNCSAYSMQLNSCRYCEQDKACVLQTFQEHLRVYWRVKLVGIKQKVLRVFHRIV